MQRNDRSYKDLKQKQKSAIADKTYKMHLKFYLENQRMPDATEMNDICKSLFTAVQSLAPKTEYEEFYKIVEKREKSYEERILRDIQNGIIIETLMAKKHKKTPEEKAAVAKQKKQQRRARRKQETRDNLAKEEILQDDRFFVIAGYTSGGAPYGVTWEEMGLKPWEDLEENKGKGYDSNSVIGRSGIESLYEDKLKGQNGCMIYIEDEFGNRKDIIVDKPVQNGEDIQLTIDAELQKVLYEQFKDDKSCSVAMNQYTGEVLALVSTPSFNSNDFVMGMSDKLWKSLNEDERQPLYNRFRQVWCPGSTFKPVTAVIGLDTGILDPVEDYGNEGLSWQKDSSWGDYYVTTLHETEPATLENAMIYSDNIYFAKVALKLGENNLTSFLEKLGFNKEIPFDIKMSISQYSNTEGIKSEIQLADSGYGQGQILINPLHLASIYSAFSNDGNIIEPTLLYNPNYNPNIWMPEVIQKESIHTVLETMKKVISEPTATGYGLHREEYTLAGKTGTAEIKLSKEDATGTELGWMAVFTTDPNIENPILLISMVEDVKNIGGSGYVVQKDKRVLDQYLR